ncbi:MAG TPA: alanine--tRNA ligase, partial [Alphaproteobacteria bacterium]|nr:alanine--tRNA ligase [Alphaproteobacteria bacterium]
RKVLGSHVTQKGSLVEDDFLRFDFSNQKGLTSEEILEIEKQVNSQILANLNTSTKIMPVKDAIEAGAMALFGEKYGDEVRVIAMGKENYSVELCGGTHINQTGDIGLFKLVGETAVASGIRRIEALTGIKALEYFNTRENIISALQGKLKTSAEELNNRVQKLMDEKRDSEKEISDLKRKLALASNSGGAGGENEVEEINGIKFITKKLDGIDAKDLREIVNEYKKKYTSSVVIIVSENEGKGSLVVGVTDDITSKISAVEIIKKISSEMGGKGGGGRPDYAQGGVTSTEGFDKAIELVKTHAR